MDNRVGFVKPGGTHAEEADDARSDAPVSLWLYLAGLCVTLAGLYAVNFGIEDANFASMTYGLAIAGYVFNYVARVRRIDLNAVKMPLLMSAGLLLLAYVSGSGAGWLLPAGIGSKNPMGMQVLFAWLAIVHTFLLWNDASVLFACVPAMTMLALVSASSPDPEVENAFIVFIAASTFLMVHENYLRSRNAKTLRSSVPRSDGFFSGQVLLTCVCLCVALMLANLVAVPIKIVGQAIFKNSAPASEDAVTRLKQDTLLPINVDESTTLKLAQGPVAESDTLLLQIEAPHSRYWRGTTFSNYTGRSFENHDQASEVTTLVAETPAVSPVTKLRQYSDVSKSSAFNNLLVYKVPPNEYELRPEEMKDSRTEKQQIQVVGGVFNSLYGAALAREVTTIISGLKCNSAGTLRADVPASAYYEIVSQVPTDDEQKLRQVKSSEEAPAIIRRAYLQVAVEHPEDTQKVRELAQSLIEGKTNNFDKAEAIRSYVAATCKYNLQVSPAPLNRDVVAWFLFDKKEGYCDSFAAAMTMLCRYANMPARLVSGFLPGEVDAHGKYLVREKHKHVWTEVFFPHIGWVPFDATEGTIDISEHNSETKKPKPTFVKWLLSHGSLPLAMTGALLALLGYVVKTEVVDRVRVRQNGTVEAHTRPQTNLQVMALYAQTTALLGKRGLPRQAYQTPNEYGFDLTQRLSTPLPDVSRDMEQLTALYTHVRYGRETATPEEVETAQRLAASIRQRLQSAKRGELAG